MKKVMHGMLALVVLTFSLLLSVPAMATTVTVGAPGDPGNGNAFPFGGTISPNPGTRYQQVYNSSLFPGLMTINEISFFNTQHNPGQASFDTATYEIHLSTTPQPVNGLDTVNFDDNVGDDDQLFFTGVIGGVMGMRITFVGVGFSYDPEEGNLLLDILKSGSLSDGNAFLDARNGTFGDDSSRAHDFGSEFEEWGLVTEFSDGQNNNVVPEPSTFLLLGAGLVGVGLLRKKFTS
ncbi:MAG: hypothetical protein FD174_3903 [Geobacteraceae bacterium]|nr:MAG: hypothetical protein FD174_3903 [Geobacteraceae bacterium]